MKASEQVSVMYSRNMKKKSRDILQTTSDKTTFSPEILRNLPPAPFLRALLAIVPAISCGCSGEMEIIPGPPDNLVEQTTLHFSGACMTSEGKTLDIFTFEDDAMKRLDSYQRFENHEDTRAYITSTEGDKVCFICADGHLKRHDWSNIYSYASLEKIYCELEKETHERYTKTGHCSLTAGYRKGIVTLSPLVSEIYLESICCNFKGTPYEGEVLRDVKAYLTNVNATCSLTSPNPASPVRIINTGMLNPYDMKNFEEPEIIMQVISERIGNKEVRPEALFLCYPNISKEEGPGTPNTRLVIEGTIASHTYYWPITIRTGDDGSPGVERNCRYSYEVLITRKGVTDPDTPIDYRTADINLKIKPWKETEEYGVRF